MSETPAPASASYTGRATSYNADCFDQLVQGGLGEFLCKQFPYGAYRNIQPVGEPRVVGVAAKADAAHPYSGSVQDAKHSKFSIEWSVGPETYLITKAIVFEYKYTDDSGEAHTGNLLFGFNGPPW